MGDGGVRGLFVGRSTVDLVYACPRFPEPDAKVDADWSSMSPGGPALTASVVFAGLGGAAQLCSVVGAGPLADWARQDLGRWGVELSDAAGGEADVLPVSAIFLTGSSRAIVNPPLPQRAAAASEPLGEALFQPRPDIVLSDGHLPELAVPILRRAREAGIPTVLDGGSWKPWTGELLPWIDMAIVSARFRPPAENGVSDPLELLARRVRAAAVTDGPRPIRWRAEGAVGEVIPPEVEAVDSLGAGDVFHGAFCHAYASVGNFVGALEAAAEAASRSVASRGTRQWLTRPADGGG